MKGATGRGGKWSPARTMGPSPARRTLARLLEQNHLLGACRTVVGDTRENRDLTRRQRRRPFARPNQC
jgi:hypothetical protein